MHLLLALQQLGYENVTDFEISHINPTAIAEWKHTDPQPDQAALDTAWADWQAANPGPSLDDQKTSAHDVIDRAAENARLRHITPGAGQAMAYQEKAEEAADYIAAGYPAATGSPPTYDGYPFITAEVNATGKTSTEAADDIISQRSAWVTVGAQIEQERLGGKKAVTDAVDTAGVESARDTAVAALDAI